MFKEQYQQEMQDTHASEVLIADTLKKMQAEQEKLHAEQLGERPEQVRPLAQPQPQTQQPAQSQRTAKKTLFFRAALPLAACLIFALVGVLAVPQIAGLLGQNTQAGYDFQPVNGKVSVAGGLQFGSISQQQGGPETDLKYAECPRAFLPEGILDATPTTFGTYLVYLGFDKEQSKYYAAYREDNTSKTWVLLQSNALDDTGNPNKNANNNKNSEAHFIETLEAYFAKNA
ncbi:MAG: hypothetical protein LBB42_05205 [Coriobacteriales bacterium]|jgi:hypothetical protein|nr:hypothetical protein [Coriobacteriales bacterium]